MYTPDAVILAPALLILAVIILAPVGLLLAAWATLRQLEVK